MNNRINKSLIKDMQIISKTIRKAAFDGKLLLKHKHPIVEEEMLILFLVFQNDHQIKRMKNFIISVKFYDFSLLFLYF